MSPSDEEFPKESKQKPSEKKIRANKINAQKSSGPRNTLRTRHNAVRHGLLSDGVSELDFSAGFGELFQELTEEYNPVGRIETHLIEKIALYMIRIRRARSLEADFLNQRGSLPSLRCEGA